MWRVLLTVSNTMMLKGLCCKKVFIPNLSALFCANPVISNAESNCLALLFPLPSCTLVVLGREAWKALTCGIRYWTMHSENLLVAGNRRELASCSPRTTVKPKKRRRGSSGDAVKDVGRVLHHLCWADDLYAMAGTMNHLTRILEDMTNAIERFGHEMEREKSYHCCWAIHGVQTWRCC